MFPDTVDIKTRLIVAIHNRFLEINATPKQAALTSTPNPEECLRTLMIKYYPKLNEILATYADNEAVIIKLLKTLIQLAPIASTDLRYFDVFNNYYEKISPHQLVKNSPSWLEFLQAYAYILEKQLDKINNEYSDFFIKDCNNKTQILEAATFPTIKPGMKVLILADHFASAARILTEISQIKDIESHVLICKNQLSSFFRFMIKQVSAAMYSGKIKLLIQALIKKRLHIFFHPLHNSVVTDWLKTQKYSVGLHSMGVIYRQPIIDSFSAGILNSHIGVLPRFQGRSVLEWSVLTRCATGVTVFFLDKGIDTGAHIVHRHFFNCKSFNSIAQAKDFAFKLDGILFKQALTKLLCNDYHIELNEGGTRYYVMSGLFSTVVNAILKENRSLKCVA